jgi:hypothetical protein
MQRNTKPPVTKPALEDIIADLRKLFPAGGLTLHLSADGSYSFEQRYREPQTITR